MTKKLLLIIATLGLFVSCKKSSDPATETPAPETIKEMTIAVTGPKTVSSANVQQGTGSLNFLGYGYNINGKYADTSAVKAQVINIPAYAAANPLRVDLSRSTSGGFESVYGKDAEDYLYKISSNVEASNGKSLFKNTIASTFPALDALSGKYIYAQYVYDVKWKHIRTYLGDAEVKNYLTAEFKNDVQSLTPENLVKKYGTHVLSGIELGEKLHIYFQAKTTANDRLHSAHVGLTYTLKKAFGIMSGFLDPLKPADINAITEPRLVYETIGGDPSKVNKLETTNGTMITFNDWLPTCTEDKALFIDIMPGGLTPLYELITDPNKKAEVKSYITTYIEQNQVKI